MKKSIRIASLVTALVLMIGALLCTVSAETEKVTVDVYQYQDSPKPDRDGIVSDFEDALNGSGLKVSWLSNHGGGQTRMVSTPSGVYFGLFTGEDADAPTININLIRLKGDGTSESVFASTMPYNPSGPMCSVMADSTGKIYFYNGYDPLTVGESRNGFLFTMWVYDPATGETAEYQEKKTYAQGDARSYGGGGYSTTAIDEKNGRILAVTNVGNKPGDMEWCYFDMKTCTWSDLKYATLDYRYCYTFMVPDGDGGFHVFNQRDVQVTAVKTDYGKNVETTSRATKTNWYDNNMLFDEWDYFHIPDPDADGIEGQTAVEKAQYEWAKGLYPDCRADSADIMMDAQGHLHFIYEMSENVTYGTRVVHVVYDVTDGLKEIRRQTFDFAGGSNTDYYARLFQDTTGAMYVVAFRSVSTPVELEIWGSSDPTGEMELLYAEIDDYPGLQIAGTAVTTSRNGGLMTDVMEIGLYSYEIKWYHLSVDFAKLRAYLAR